MILSHDLYDKMWASIYSILKCVYDCKSYLSELLPDRFKISALSSPCGSWPKLSISFIIFDGGGCDTKSDIENCFLCGDRDETAKSATLKLWCLVDDGDGVDVRDGFIRDSDWSRDFDSLFELVFDGGFIIAFNASCWSFA